jgi:hypothetical protein
VVFNACLPFHEHRDKLSFEKHDIDRPVFGSVNSL